jgi:hypothetical protein
MGSLSFDGLVEVLMRLGHRVKSEEQLIVLRKKVPVLGIHLGVACLLR